MKAASAAAILLAALFLGASALAFEVDAPLADPAQEVRAQALARQLRCLVCQNQSIAESNAPLANDLRQVVRERIVAGDSDPQVIAYLVKRYGDWILLEPPFRLGTYVLWLGPAVLLLLAGGVAVVSSVRSRARSTAGPPLSAAERERLEALLDDDSGA